MTDIIIFPLEPLDARYTKQWFDEVPVYIQNYLDSVGDSGTVYSIAGQQNSQTTTSGAFLNFTDTNYWKSSQVLEFVKLFEAGNVADDAVFLFTDFWNPVIIQIAYMRDLMGTNWKIHSIAHAGAYDPSDILGYKMREEWPHDFERSLFYACDATYFASEFHRDMFLTNLNISSEFHHRAVFSGQPYMYLFDILSKYNTTTKTDTIMWPHRYNDDKQPEIAEDLSDIFDVFITQKHQLSKDEYYAKLASSKIVFSCSLHENLGMSMIEGSLVGCIPIVPDRCAYSEIYFDEFKYPSEWTTSFDAYDKHKDDIIAFIQDKIDNYDYYDALLSKQITKIQKYISPNIMIENMVRKTK